MRTLIVVVALAAAGRALAQAPVPQPYVDLQRDLDARTVAGMQAAKERDTSLRNDLSTLQATVQTRQVLSDIAAAGVRPAIPTVPFDPKAPPPRIDERDLAQIPDSRLAASNARALAASRNKR